MILEDTRMKMQSWGAAGTFDPFDKIYEVSLALLFVCAGLDRLFFFRCDSSSFKPPFGVFLATKFQTTLRSLLG